MPGFEPIAERDEQIGRQVLDSAFAVHKTLGPGLLESVYEHCLALEFDKRGVAFEKQPTLPIQYGETVVDAGLRLDLLVGSRVVVELKAVETLLPIHETQLFTYLKLSGRRLGLLLNFNTQYLKDGIKRVVL